VDGNGNDYCCLRSGVYTAGKPLLLSMKKISNKEYSITNIQIFTVLNEMKIEY
jgi:hypothetical protein